MMTSESAFNNPPVEISEQCSISGLPIHSRPEWTLVDCGDGFRSTVYVLGRDIVVCRPYGNATGRSVAAALEITKEAVHDVVGLNRPYIKIEDYASLGRVAADARRFFSDYVKSEPYLQRQIFCNVSNLMRISIKLGKRVLMSPLQLEIADNFDDAVRMALEIRKTDAFTGTKQHIRYCADPFAEYESGGLCPVSNLEITKRPEWSGIRIGLASQVSLQWIGPSILHVALRGKLDADGIRAVARHKIRAVADWQSDAEVYVEIIDATEASVGRSSQLFNLFQPRTLPLYRKVPVAGIVIQAGAFYNIEAFLRRLFPPFATRILTAANYREAVLRAVAILKDLGYAYQYPMESISSKDWELSLPGFTASFEIINGDILHGCGSGSLEVEHVEKLFELHYRLLEQIGPPSAGYAVVSGIRHLQNVSLAARKSYIEAILKQHRRYPVNQYIFYGANPRLRAMVNLSRPLIPFPVTMVKDLDSALNCAAQPAPGASTARPAGRPGHAELSSLKHFADDLIQYMGSINWEENGMDTELMKVDPLNPLRPAYEAIALIKMDLDYLHQERRRVECSLVESENKYRTILDSINEGYFEMDLNHTLCFFNDATCRILGYAQEELKQASILDMLALPYRSQALKAFDDIKNTGATRKTAQWQYQRKDGSCCHIETSIAPMVGEDGAIAGFRGLFRDITQRIEAEEVKRGLEAQLQQAQKMEALGTLAGGVAHDLNNILIGLVTYPDMLLQKLAAESPLRNGLETIKKSGKKAATIVQDLLSLARRGVGAKEILSLNRIVRDYLDSPEHANLMRHHGDIDLKLTLASDLLNISGSAVHLSKTLMNLVSNAVEAMPGGGRMSISTQNLRITGRGEGTTGLEDGEYVALTVTDSGIGISAEDRERIFEPFYTKKIMGRSGTGLGMAVVWGTVMDHSGHITLVSEKGKGTTFTLYFPVDRSEPIPPKRPVPVEAYMGRGESILVVDDQPLQRDLLEEMLSGLGYAVHCTDSGEAAVDYMQTHAADLLILDMIMDPGIDGYETYRRICEIHPHQRAILCSGFSESDRVLLARQLGAGAYLRKPYSMEQLGQAVRTELDR